MSRRRPGTAGSIRCTSVAGVPRVRPRSRPGSAREWYEAYNQRRNEEAWRMDDWQNTVNINKRREWEAQFYTHIAQPPQKIPDEEDWRRKEEKERKLASRRAKLKALLEEDERQYQVEREQKYQESRGGCIGQVVYPEVDMLKCRLEELKKKNEEERRKMTESLSYEIWRRNHPKVRQMESERLNHFVQEAWVNQRQWKEDERQRRAEQDRKHEREAAALQQQYEQEEHSREEERIKKQAEWKVQLEAQIEQIKERERQTDALRGEEILLEKERLRLHEINQRRTRMKELRQRKELELYWARQYQLKLKKRAADIQQELLEDESIVEDLLRVLPTDDADQQMQQRRAEAEWMKAVLGEQRRLEVLREKEYELLFSEEAEIMWKKRQAEWQKELRARDKLMSEVIVGLQQQVQENLAKNSQERHILDMEKSELQRCINDTREQMDTYEQQEHQRQQKLKSDCTHSKVSARTMEEAAALRREREEGEQQLQEHRQEIQRLENEMARLWGPKYAPPRFGRKRFAW